MSDIKNFIKNAMKEIKEKNFKKALNHLEIVLLKQSSHYQGLLLTIKCQIEMEQYEQANNFIEKAEEHYPDDINIKMAALNVLKKSEQDNNILIEKQFEILEILIQQKDIKKIMSLLKNIYENMLDDQFENYKEKIIELSMEILNLLENKQDYKMISDFFQKQYSLQNLGDLEFQELLEQQPLKIEASPQVREILEEKSIQKLENTLDKSNLKKQLINKPKGSDILRMYQIKHGVFDYKEMCQYINELNDGKKSTHQEIIIFAMNYLQDIFKEQNYDFEINMLKIEGNSDVEDMAYEYMDFIIKIKESFENLDKMKFNINNFIIHFKIFDMAWLRYLICYRLFNDYDYVQKNQHYLKQILDAFLLIENDDWGKVFLISQGNFFSYLLRSKNFDFDEDQMSTQNELINNILNFDFDKINPDELLLLDSKWSYIKNENFHYHQLGKYLNYIICLKAIKDKDENKMSEILLQWQQNFFLLNDLIKLKFLLNENLEEIFEYLKEKEYLQYVLRRKENFQIYYTFVYRDLNLEQKLELFSDYFSFLQDQKWFQILLIPLLFQYRDFSNCFSVSRRLYDSLEQYIVKAPNLPQFTQEDYFFIQENSYLILDIGFKKMKTISQIFDHEYITTDFEFQNNFLNQFIQICKLTQKYTLCHKIISNMIDCDFQYKILEQNSIENEGLYQSFNDFLNLFVQKNQLKLVGKIDLLIEDLDLLALSHNYQRLRTQIYTIQQELKGKFVSYHSYLNPIFIMIKNIVKSVPEQIPSLQQKFNIFIEELTKFLKTNKNQLIQFSISYFIKISLLLKINLKNELIEQILQIQSEFQTFDFNQFLINENQNLEKEKLDLITTQFKQLYFEKQIIDQYLFFSYNQQKESILSWLLLVRYFINNSKYDFAERALLKVQYLLKENEEEIHVDYFNLMILELKQYQSVDKELVPDLKVIQKFKKITFQEKLEKFDITLLEEDIYQKWIELKFYELSQLCQKWILIQIKKGNQNIILEQIYKIKEYLQSRKKEFTFEVISQLQSFEDNRNFSKLIKTLFYLCQKINSEDKQKILKLIQIFQNTTDLRSLLLRITHDNEETVEQKQSKLFQLRQKILYENGEILERFSQKQISKLGSLLKCINQLRNRNSNYITDMKYLLLKQPSLFNEFKEFLNKKKFEYQKINTQDTQQQLFDVYKKTQLKYNLEGFISGEEIWNFEQNKILCLQISLTNCYQLLYWQQFKLNEEDQQELVDLIIKDLNFDKNLIIPLLRYLYINEQYEKFELVLNQMDSFKISQELEFHLNFYVLLYKIKLYESSQEITQEDEFDIDELYLYFNSENCPRNLLIAVQYVYSIYGLKIKKEKNIIQNEKILKFALLQNPSLYLNTKKFAFQDEEITIQQLI